MKRQNLGNSVHLFSHVISNCLFAYSNTKAQFNCVITIIIISIFKEDNVFSITACLPYGPPVNTDIDYYLTFSDCAADQWF